MDQLESNNNNMGDRETQQNYTYNISSNAEASRAPQLSSTVPGQGGNAQGCSDKGGGADGNGNSNGDKDFAIDYDTLLSNGYISDDDDANDDGYKLSAGQEGVEGNQLTSPGRWTPGCTCSCHHKGRVPRLFTYSPPHCPDTHSPTITTMATRGDSGDRSPVHSHRDYVVRSLTIPETAFESPYELRWSLVHHPLALNPEPAFPQRVDVSYFYPTTISIDEENQDEDEMMQFGLRTPPV